MGTTSPTTTKRSRRTTRKETVPQPAANPAADKETAADKAKREAAERADREWAELVERASAGDSSPAKQIRRAIELERQISDLRKKIDNNRTYLRLMDQNEELNEDQADFVDTFYPEKERGKARDREDIEATRRARTLARRNGSDE